MAPARPPVRTFKPRRRPLSTARADLFERLMPRYGLDESGPPIDPVGVFRRRAPLVIEIGIGLGVAFTELAAAEPASDAIGIDVHTPGLASTLARIEQEALANVRVVHGDGLVFLERIRPGQLAGIRTFFPDPWPKARHRHRRLVSAGHLDRFVDALAPGGTLHVATDAADYAAQVERLAGAHPALRGGVVERPSWRPLTRYERKAHAEGRAVTDLVFERR